MLAIIDDVEKLDTIQDGLLVVYYESIKRELKIRPTNDCRCDERLKTKAEDSTRLRIH